MSSAVKLSSTKSKSEKWYEYEEKDFVENCYKAIKTLQKGVKVGENLESILTEVIQKINVNGKEFVLD